MTLASIRRYGEHVIPVSRSEDREHAAIHVEPVGAGVDAGNAPLLLVVEFTEHDEELVFAGTVNAAILRPQYAVLKGIYDTAAVRENVLMRRQAAAAAKDRACVFERLAASGRAFELAFDWWGDERLSWWDALLVSTAVQSGMTAIVSEDVSDGTIQGGIEIINPFTANLKKRLAVGRASVRRLPPWAAICPILVIKRFPSLIAAPDPFRTFRA